MFDWWHRLFPRIPAGQPAGAGARGERRAEDYLRRERGFHIVARNWRNPRDRRDELDLVARDGEALVFIEVKARAAGALVPGQHAVDERKREALRRTIRAYLAGLREKPRTVRFDIVAVVLPGAEAGRGSRPEVQHFAGVPLFPPHWRP